MPTKSPPVMKSGDLSVGHFEEALYYLLYEMAIISKMRSHPHQKNRGRYHIHVVADKYVSLWTKVRNFICIKHYIIFTEHSTNYVHAMLCFVDNNITDAHFTDTTTPEPLMKLKRLPTGQKPSKTRLNKSMMLFMSHAACHNVCDISLLA